MNYTEANALGASCFNDTYLNSDVLESKINQYRSENFAETFPEHGIKNHTRVSI